MNNEQVDLLPNKSWKTIRHINRSVNSWSYNIETLLDGSFQSANNIPGLKTQLYPHQKVVVQSMIDMENNCEFKLHSSKNNGLVYDVSCNAAVLSEKVGSGKTFDVLALILSQPIPKGLGYDIDTILHKECPYNRNLSMGLVVKKTFSYVLRPTLIFVGTSVLRQWADTIGKYTNLKTFVVLGIRELTVFMNMIKDKTIEKFDVILLKNGSVARVVLPEGVPILPANITSNPQIYSLVANIKTICWSRVVIDDFDTIRLKENSPTIHASFTWYVSSTRKEMKQTPLKNFSRIDCIEPNDIYTYGNFPISNSTTNPMLYYNRNVRTSSEFLEESNNLCKPQYYAYRFKDPNLRLINIMNTLDDDMKDVIEMINADAIETAAERMGIKTNSVAGIFEKILGDQYNTLLLSCRVLDFIKDQQTKSAERKPWKSIDDDPLYGVRRLEKFEEIKFNYPNITIFLDEQTIKYTELKNKAMISLNRIKDHLMEEECPVCNQELKEECDGKIVIFKCCSIIICEECCFNTIFQRTHMGSCPNCRTNLNIKELIYVNKDINLDEIISQVETGEFQQIQQEVVPNIIPKPIKKSNTKYNAIIDIIRGESLDNCQQVNVIIPQLMAGSTELPEAPIRKVLIFANYDETLSKIQTKMQEEKINYEKLGGTAKQIAEIVERFKTSDTLNVLLICAAKYCAGLNLQMATDLIFTHLIVDDNVETQVAGRLIRLGRKYAARFHYLLYEHEYTIKHMSNRMLDI